MPPGQAGLGIGGEESQATRAERQALAGAGGGGATGKESASQIGPLVWLEKAENSEEQVGVLA